MHRCQHNSLDITINYYHDAFKPMQYRQAKYKVHGIVIEPNSRRFQWLQRTWWALGKILNPLTHGAPCHVCIYVCSFVRPPESLLQSL